MAKIQYTSVGQEEGERGGTKTSKGRSGDDESTLNKRMPFCIGLAVVLAIVYVLSRTSSAVSTACEIDSSTLDNFDIGAYRAARLAATPPNIIECAEAEAGASQDACHLPNDKRFAAHRAVLAAASSVFAKNLGSGMKESQTQEIVIEDADERSVQDTLEYIYTGTVGAQAGCGMVVLGHKYDIPGLVEYAAPVALGNLTNDNVVEEVRTLRAYADDKQLGPVFEALQNKVHENEELFKAILLGI